MKLSATALAALAATSGVVSQRVDSAQTNLGYGGNNNVLHSAPGTHQSQAPHRHGSPSGQPTAPDHITVRRSASGESSNRDAPQPGGFSDRKISYGSLAKILGVATAGLAVKKVGPKVNKAYADVVYGRQKVEDYAKKHPGSSVPPDYPPTLVQDARTNLLRAKADLGVGGMAIAGYAKRVPNALNMAARVMRGQQDMRPPRRVTDTNVIYHNTVKIDYGSDSDGRRQRGGAPSQPSGTNVPSAPPPREVEPPVQNAQTAHQAAPTWENWKRGRGRRGGRHRPVSPAGNSSTRPGGPVPSERAPSSGPAHSRSRDPERPPNGYVQPYVTDANEGSQG